jgi:hypothetical protein
MKKVLVVPGAALVAALAVVAAAPAAAPGNGKGVRTLVAKLSGANEVPAAAAGDRGNVVVRLNAGALRVCWSFSALKLTSKDGTSTTPTAAHIHVGAAGVPGAVVVPFGATFTRNGCATTTKALIDAIVANPSGYYVNVHNASYPGGAIRGQLKKGSPTP